MYLSVNEAPVIVGVIIESLKSRGGFDDWWHDIDAVTRMEIVDDLVDTLLGETF